MRRTVYFCSSHDHAIILRENQKTSVYVMVEHRHRIKMNIANILFDYTYIAHLFSSAPRIHLMNIYLQGTWPPKSLS